MEKNKMWIWRAYNPIARRPLAWEMGSLGDACCKRLLDKFGIQGHTFLTDDWPGFVRLIPDDQLFTGKDLTFHIEQSNGDIRHHLARFRRRSKVTSRSTLMVHLSLLLFHSLSDPAILKPYLDSISSIFS